MSINMVGYEISEVCKQLYSDIIIYTYIFM